MVYQLRGYPDGLYAVGSFMHAGNVEANGLARWDGSAWHSVFDLPVIEADAAERAAALFGDGFDITLFATGPGNAGGMQELRHVVFGVIVVEAILGGVIVLANYGTGLIPSFTGG